MVFPPKKLLSDIIDVYLHLNCDLFLDALVRDERSYSKATYDKATRIIEKTYIKSSVCKFAKLFASLSVV